MDFTTKHEPEPFSGLDDSKEQSGSVTGSLPAEPPVANLIEGFRSKRQAWIAEAEALARMRDEVRGAAERERMEIITRARERARAVIANARRDLLTLTAQVEASLGPADTPQPVAELFRGGSRRALGDSDASRQAGPSSRNTGSISSVGSVQTTNWSREDFDFLRREK